MIWIFNAPNIENDAAYIELVEKTINSQYPRLYQLVKTYQVHAYSIYCWKQDKNECRFYYGQSFTEKKMIVKPNDTKFSITEKQEVLTWRNT